MSNKKGKQREAKPSDMHHKELAPAGPVVETNTASGSRRTGGDTVYQETRDGFILSFNVVREISEATELLAPLKSTCLLINRGLETTRIINSNKKAWGALTSRLERQLGALEHYRRRLRGHRCNSELSPIEPLKDYAEVVQNVLSEAVKAEKRSKTVMRRIVRANLDAEDFIDWTIKIDDAYKQFMEAMEVLQWIQVANQGLMIEEIRDDIRHLKSSGGLTTNDEAAFLELAYGARLDICQEGTRTEILGRIMAWVEDGGAKEQIFWLADLAGTGKSTIAATVAHNCLDRRQLAGRFFFTPNSRTSSGLTDFCVTVAKDMSRHLSMIWSTINEAIASTPSTDFSTQQQFTRLLVNPLKQIDDPVVLVFDALDNCDEEGHRMLLDLLLKNLPSIPKVKVFLTSRPLESIKAFLDESSIVTGRDIELYSIDDKFLNPDIVIYINENFNLRYVTAEQRIALAVRSKGLFIWAATACRLFQNNRRPNEILSLLLYSTSANNLDGLYLEILKKALVDPDAHEGFMSVLQIVISAIEPVSISTIQIFLPQNPSVSAFIQDLCSVLKDGDPYRPIHVIHPTFREFLTQNARANGFLVQYPVAHSALAEACLSCMCTALHYDMAGQQTADGDPPEYNKTAARSNLVSSLSRPTLEAVLYAAKYWTQHLISSASGLALGRIFIQFMEERLLNWMELLSIFELVPLGIGNISALSTFLKSSTDARIGNETDLCDDALRFMQKYQEIISTSALQIYRSALPFTPHSASIFQNHFPINQKRAPDVVSGLPATWGMHLTLNGHIGCIVSLAFSPDRSRIASIGAKDNILRLWDAKSGAHLGPHDQSMWTRDHVNMVIFTADGETIITDSDRNDILLWDAKNGDQREARFIGHTDTIIALATSPNGLKIASASKDSTVRLWLASSGDCIGSILSDHQAQISGLVFSPSSALLAATSDEELSIWSSAALASVRQVSKVGHGGLTLPVFMPDEQNILIGSDDHLVYVMPVDHSTIVRILNGLPGAIKCCTITKSGSQIAAGDAKGNLLVWDSGTGRAVCEVVQIHLKSVDTISFTPDNLKLITISDDETFGIRDIMQEEHVVESIGGEGACTTAFSISQDSRQVAVGYWNGSIGLYQVGSSAIPSTRQSVIHLSRVTSLAISSDYTTIASGSKDKTIVLWNGSTGQRIGNPLQGHEGTILCMAFSSNNSFLASGSEDNSVRIWNVKNGWAEGIPMVRHSNHITCVAFSRDGHYVVSGSTDNTACRWIINTEQLVVTPMIGHTSEITCIAISDDVGRIITGSRDRTIRQWNLQTGKEYVNSKIECKGPIKEVVISPCGGYLAYVSVTEMEIWTLGPTSSIIGHSKCSPWGRTSSLYFSEDSLYVWVGEGVWKLVDGRIHEVDPRNVPLHPCSRIRLDGNNLDNWVVSLIHPHRTLFRIPDEIIVGRWMAYKALLVIGTLAGGVIIINCSSIIS